uniref:glycosyltransferase family 9 protein n=1 Tax=Flavobacterium sp. TaxID=239 RepID=UPI00404A4140
MNLLKKINVFRKKTTKLLTKSVGKQFRSLEDVHQIKDLSAIKNILIIRPNHRLGNTILFTPLVKEVTQIFPNATIDLFVKGEVSKIVFKKYATVKNHISLPKKHFKEFFKYLKAWFTLLFSKYDLVINVEASSSSGKLATKISNSKYKIYGTELDNLTHFNDEQKHFAKLPIYKLRHFISKTANEIFTKEIPNLDLYLDEKEIENGLQNLNRIIEDKNKKTIAVYTFATGNKCYSKEWWKEFYEKLVLKHPNYNFIEVLPIENVSQINFIAPTYYSKDIREMAATIKNTALFITADNGIMHLACSTDTKIVGLFSVTKMEKYGPYGNSKIGIDTNKNSIDQCIEKIEQLLKS